MHVFHLVVWVFSVRSVKDTQCGFKLFSREAGRWLFWNQRLHGWAFDAELLLIAEKKNIPIVEVAVTWNEIPGSKLNLLQASFTMARELVVIWFAHTFGLWKISPPKLKRS
jgi:dolichyl-phosphate beta-glucosyltransferase